MCTSHVNFDAIEGKVLQGLCMARMNNKEKNTLFLSLDKILYSYKVKWKKIIYIRKKSKTIF